MNITLRNPTQEEFIKAATFSFDYFVSETARSTGESPALLKEQMGGPPTRRSKSDIWYLVEANENQIGFVWIQLKQENKTAFGYDIYLGPQYRSQGIGRKVMLECGKKLDALGINLIEICVYEHNENARKLYYSLGFKQIAFDEEKKQFTLLLNMKELNER